MAIDIVRADVRPADARPSREHRRWTADQSRRQFLRLCTGAAVGAGMAFAGVFPTARPAYATHQTPALPLSSSCYGPGNGRPLAGSTGCCACGSYVSSSMCGSDNWHEHHTRAQGPASVFYQLRTTSCGGRNAWLWTIRGTTRRWRCSDGRYYACAGGGCSSWTNSVCPVRA
jgi:hypothetical protein